MEWTTCSVLALQPPEEELLTGETRLRYCSLLCYWSHSIYPTGPPSSKMQTNPSLKSSTRAFVMEVKPSELLNLLLKRRTEKTLRKRLMPLTVKKCGELERLSEVYDQVELPMTCRWFYAFALYLQIYNAFLIFLLMRLIDTVTTNLMIIVLEMLPSACLYFVVKGRWRNGGVQVVKRVHDDFDDEFPYIKEEISNTIVMLVLVKNEKFEIWSKGNDERKLEWILVK